MPRESISSIDTAILRLEDPTNLMIVTGVLTFSKPMQFERLKATVESRLLRIDRFRQRVVQPWYILGNPYWEEDPDFEIYYHLQPVSLPPPGDEATLQMLVSQLASSQLDLSRPLWQFHLVEKYGQGSALICRLHHCIGDGMALMRVLLSLTDASPDSTGSASQSEALQSIEQNQAETQAWPDDEWIEAKYRSIRRRARKGLALFSQPERVREVTRLGTDSAATLGRLILPESEPETALSGKLGIHKRVAWSAPIPLEAIKAAGRRMGGTVNDILLTAVSGALRRYLLEHDTAIDGLNLRAAIPVNLRAPEEVGKLGNRFGVVFLSLPVDTANPAARMQEIKRRMNERKNSLEAPVNFTVMQILGRIPASVQNLLISRVGMKATVVLTNVAGPQEQLYLAGSPLEALMFWVPKSGGVGIGISMLSYAGQVWLGVITDENLAPDPENLIADLQAEFEILMALEQADTAPADKNPWAQLDETLADLEAMLEKGDT